MAAALSPCSTRPRISTAGEVARPQITDVSPNPVTPPRESVFLALLRSARMQTESGHPKGCMVALGVVGASSIGSEAVTQLLREVRNRTRAGFRACVSRGIKSGELRSSTDPASLAIAFDCFFQGLSMLARDRVRQAVIEKAVTDAMGMWDAALNQPMTEPVRKDH